MINTVQITAVKIKANKNDGSFKNKRDYLFVADIHVSGKEKPFTIYLTKGHEEELSRFMREHEREEVVHDHKHVDRH